MTSLETRGNRDKKKRGRRMRRTGLLKITPYRAGAGNDPTIGLGRRGGWQE